MESKRESIVFSAIRVFFKFFAGICGTMVGLIIIGIILVMVAKPQMITDKTMMNIKPDANGNRQVLPTSTPVILRVDIHGVIGSRDLNRKTIRAQLLGSREDALKNNRVKAILLHINSPGGTVVDSYDIYQQLVSYKARYQVPIYAFVEGMCASGGMMVACSADKIVSGPVGIIGSVGVLMGPNFNIADLMEKYGIKQLTLTKGKNKDTLNPFRAWKEGEEDPLKELLSYNYNLFVNIVTNARPLLNRKKLIDEYGAQIFDPIKAAKYGYIDEGQGNYDAFLTELVKHCGIKEDEKYQVAELKIPRPVLSDLIEGKSPIFSGRIQHELLLGPDFHPELMNRPLYLFSPALQMFDLNN